MPTWKQNEKPEGAHSHSQKKARDLEDLVLPWMQYDCAIAAEIVGDNELVIHWANGAARTMDPKHTTAAEQNVNELGRLWYSGLIAPRVPTVDWCRHVFRERNKAADALANRAMDSSSSAIWTSSSSVPDLERLCVNFDGGKRPDGSAACGWHLQGGTGREEDGTLEWYTLAWGSLLLNPGETRTAAELMGLTEAVAALCEWAEHQQISNGFRAKYG